MQQQAVEITGITGYRRREERSNSFFQKREEVNGDKTEISHSQLEIANPIIGEHAGVSDLQQSRQGGHPDS